MCCAQPGMGILLFLNVLSVLQVWWNFYVRRTLFPEPSNCPVPVHSCSHVFTVSEWSAKFIFLLHLVYWGIDIFFWWCLHCFMSCSLFIYSIPFWSDSHSSTVRLFILRLFERALRLCIRDPYKCVYATQFFHGLLRIHPRTNLLSSSVHAGAVHDLVPLPLFY